MNEPVLRRMREVAQSELADGVVIEDIVYRDMDLGVFGRQGYSLVLACEPSRVLGKRWQNAPSDAEIRAGVSEIQRVIQRRT